MGYTDQSAAAEWAFERILSVAFDRENAKAFHALLASIEQSPWYPGSEGIDGLVQTKGRKPILSSKCLIASVRLARMVNANVGL